MLISQRPITVNYQAPPCGVRGLGCAGNCQQCPATRPAGMRGLGAFYDSFPAPLNNPIVLLAIAAVVLIIFGGGFKLFGRGRNKSGRRAKLRLIQARADFERAQALQ